MAIQGQRIVEIRQMTDEEMEFESWEDYRGYPTVLVLEDGTLLYPSQDEGGNGGGALFGRDVAGRGFTLVVGG